VAIFVVSFLVFTAAALLLVLSQRARGGQLPVGCTPASGECCRVRHFGNCIEPDGGSRGSFDEEGVRHWSPPAEYP
jgi:hypothetical protein